MNFRDISALFCKLLGLYVLIQALNSLPAFILTVMTTSQNSQIAGKFPSNFTALSQWLVVSPVLINFLAGIGLWKFADNIAEKMVANLNSTNIAVSVSKTAQTLALTLLGLWTLIQAIPHLGWMATRFFIMNQQDALMQRDLKGLTMPDIVATLIQMALGFWLVLGASGLVNLLSSLKRAGVDKNLREGLHD